MIPSYFCWNHFMASSLVSLCWKPTFPVFLLLWATLNPVIQDEYLLKYPKAKILSVFFLSPLKRGKLSLPLSNTPSKNKWAWVANKKLFIWHIVPRNARYYLWNRNIYDAIYVPFFRTFFIEIFGSFNKNFWYKLKSWRIERKPL